MLEGLYEPTDPNAKCRVSSYTAHETRDDAPKFFMFNYLVAIKDVSKFEKKNTISVNAYSIEEIKEKKKRGTDLTQEEPFIFSSDVAAPKKKKLKARCTSIVKTLKTMMIARTSLTIYTREH